MELTLEPGTDETVSKRVKLTFDIIQKSAPDAEEHFVAGWASVSFDSSGLPVIDLEGDFIPLYELKKAAHRFLREFGVGGDMHEGDAENYLLEQVITDEDFQKSLKAVCPSCKTKIEKFAPVGWWVKLGCSKETVEKVQKGGRLQFSIEGRARRERIA